MAPSPSSPGFSSGVPPWGPSPSSTNPDLDQALLKAAFDGDLRRLKKAARALDQGEGRVAAKLGAVRDRWGMGLLHAAALAGKRPMCRYLVEELRLDIDAVGPAGETPLTMVIGLDRAAVVHYLLDQGADPEKLNKDGLTALHFVTGEGNCEMIKLLLSKGANVNSLNAGGTVLHVAAHNGRADVMKILLDHNADHTIALGGTGYTALVVATVAGSLKCVKTLLEAGADVNGTGKPTPLIVAADCGLTDILKCLVLAGADPNVRDSFGRVPIETAARDGRREVVEILFPVTSRIPVVPDWSVDGILSYVKSVPPAKGSFGILEEVSQEVLKSSAELAESQIDMRNLYLICTSH